jgi:hypothetical protein
VGDELIVLAEREYQRRLAALHATRAELAEVDAALRRLAIERSRLGGAADDRDRELRLRRESLLDRARAQREDAQAQRELLQRYHGPSGPEPSELPPEDPEAGPPTGFVQPPFSEPL